MTALNRFDYPSKLELHRKDRRISGTVTLDGSKSISNRALILRALSGKDFPITGLGTSKDVSTMQALLASQEEVLDAGAAGTTFRFLTAFLAWSGKPCTLTGSERMKQRPIGPLVAALRTLGARIEYLENEGYPPLRFSGGQWEQVTRTLTLPASVSSQYLSALLMIAPRLPLGLELNLEGELVSRPYLEMTLRMMGFFGVNHTWQGQTITVEPQAYEARPFQVEADWSAASYYYSIAALSEHCNLKLFGLHRESLQGDAAIAQFMVKLGVHTEFGENHIRLIKNSGPQPSEFEYDFINCPDLAQTVMACCGGLGVTGKFTGLQTLFIKETDRIAAMQTELEKIAVRFNEAPRDSTLPAQEAYFIVEGKARFWTSPEFATYEDHRMAMAMAPLAMLHNIVIKDPGVVIKSYPAFWSDLESLGFETLPV